MNPKDLAAQLRKPTGTAGIQVGEFMAKGNANFYEQLPLVLNSKSFKKVLEIGMGSGLHIQSIASKLSINEYVAVDYSELMVEQTKENNKGVNYLTALYGNANDLQFSDDSFDLVFTINTVYFYEKLQDVFKEYYRVLKPGGFLVIGKRTKENLILLSGLTQHGFSILSANDIEAELKHSGFKLDKKEVYADSINELNGESIQLHSEFLVALK